MWVGKGTKENQQAQRLKGLKVCPYSSSRISHKFQEAAWQLSEANAYVVVRLAVLHLGLSVLEALSMRSINACWLA